MDKFPNSSIHQFSNSLFHSPCRFIAGAASLESLPPISAPEVAFAGRSNVGKSSLINALIGQKTLVKTSGNPGHTKQLNFFLLDERLMLVDMPGYGFAKVSKAKKGEWDLLIRSYLMGRPTLKRTCLLIDARRGVMKPDEDFMDVLDEAAQSFQIVLTKIDAITPREITSLLPTLKKTIQSHPAAHPDVIATSTFSKEGIDALQAELTPFAQ